MKKPDLNAPRFRPTRNSLFTRTFYREFKKKHPEYASLPNKSISNIILKFSEVLINNVVENRDGVELPENMGYIFIGTCQPKRMHNTDYKTSIEYKTKISHRNWESDSYMAKIFYTNYANKYKFKDRDLWYFKGVRDFTRLVGKTYGENWKRYVQVEKFTAINSLYKKRVTKDYFLKKTETDILDYNEFDMD